MANTAGTLHESLSTLYENIQTSKFR